VLGAVLWLLGLYAAAPVLRRGDGEYVFADRLRDALILGIAIPFVLGFANLLYPIACWLALAGCAAFAYRRRTAHAPASFESVPYITIAALALVAWPQFMRPLLDGDSLTYHLPNAASWVQSHGLWTTGTRYWWYPPASELFASALFAVAGPYAIGWSGFGALAFAGFRLAHWSQREFGAPAWLADALAAALVTAMPLALQAGTLQNDVWLAAFWLETLWLLRVGSPLSMLSIAVCALLKPYGWLMALVAAVASRARAGVWLASTGAVALWALRDAILWAHALVPPSSTAFAGIAATSIAAHGLPALVQLARVALAQSPFALIALGFALAAPWSVGKNVRALGWCAFAAVFIFVSLPFGYDNGDAQLATGASLRFAAPAIVLGALLLVIPALRAPRIAGALLLASAVFGAATIVAIFANDLPTLTCLAVAAIAVGAVVVARARQAPWVVAATLGIAIFASTLLAQRHALQYYADSLQIDSKKSEIYSWIAAVRPAKVGGWGLRSGIVNVVSPSTRIIDLPDAAPCQEARDAAALLVTVSENTHAAAENAAWLAQTRACGHVLYDDGIAVVANPGTAP